MGALLWAETFRLPWIGVHADPWRHFGEMRNAALSCWSRRELGPTRRLNCPGSTTRRVSAVTTEQLEAGMLMFTSSVSPAGMSTWVKAFNSCSAQVTLVVRSLTYA